jgi:hypothetical protein
MAKAIRQCRPSDQRTGAENGHPPLPYLENARSLTISRGSWWPFERIRCSQGPNHIVLVCNYDVRETIPSEESVTSPDIAVATPAELKVVRVLKSQTQHNDPSRRAEIRDLNGFPQNITVHSHESSSPHL